MRKEAIRNPLKAGKETARQKPADQYNGAPAGGPCDRPRVGHRRTECPRFPSKGRRVPRQGERS